MSERDNAGFPVSSKDLTERFELPQKPEDLRQIIAGLLSTIEFTPSKHHPETMLPWADQILTLFKPLAPN